MDCLNCKTTNPEGQKYCGNCGASLISNIGPPAEFLEPVIQEQLEIALKEQLRDQKLVELETVENITLRLQQWAKLFVFFMAIPITLFLIILALMGISTYSDFSKRVSDVEDRINERVSEFEQQAIQDIIVANQSITRSLELAQSLEQRVAIAQQTVSQTVQLAQLEVEQVSMDAQQSISTSVQQAQENVTNLEQRLDEVEAQVINFESSTALTPGLEKEIKDDIYSYQDYWQSLGIPLDEEVNIFIEDSGFVNAYYDHRENLMVIHSSIVSDTDVILREYTHHILFNAAHDDIKFSPLSLALESGLADYFLGSFSNDPLIAEEYAQLLVEQGILDKPYIRNLENDREFSEVSYPLSFGDEQNVGEIWGGAFWELRERIGEATADNLLFSAWRALESSDNTDELPENFISRLLEIDESLEGANADQIREVFEGRGLDF